MSYLDLSSWPKMFLMLLGRIAKYVYIKMYGIEQKDESQKCATAMTIEEKSYQEECMRSLETSPEIQHFIIVKKSQSNDQISLRKFKKIQQTLKVLDDALKLYGLERIYNLSSERFIIRGRGVDVWEFHQANLEWVKRIDVPNKTTINLGITNKKV